MEFGYFSEKRCEILGFFFKGNLWEMSPSHRGEEQKFPSFLGKVAKLHNYEKFLIFQKHRSEKTVQKIVTMTMNSLRIFTLTETRVGNDYPKKKMKLA